MSGDESGLDSGDDDTGSGVESDGYEDTPSTPWELLVVVVLLAVPVAVLPSGTGDRTVVSLWGLLNTGSEAGVGGIRLYPLWTYFADQPRPFGTLPASIQVWPLATVFHVLATASAASGVVLDREDRRVTGGLLVLAALATLWVTAGVAGRFGGVGGPRFVVPLLTLATLTLVGIAYRRDLARVVPRDPSS
ncbi:MAG: TIGR04206 family protein [Halorubrum sp.]